MATGLEKLSLVGQRRAPRLHLLLSALQSRRHRRGRKLDPGHARGFEQLLVLRTELRQLVLDQRPEMRRDDRGEGVHPGTHAPPVWSLRHHLLADQFVGQGDQEQGITTGTLMQHAAQRCREPRAPEALGEVGSDFHFGEILQCQLRTLAVLPEFGEDRPQWMGMDNGLHRAIGAEKQQAGRIGTPRYIGEPGQRGTITPVQIFHHEHQRVLGRERLQRVSELTQHAWRGDRTRSALERHPLGGRQQRRQLDEPTGGILPQHRHQPGALRSLAETSQGLQHRADTVPLCHRPPHTARVPPTATPWRSPAHKGGNQGRFANAGLPRNNPYLPDALACLRPPLGHLGQFGLASDKQRRTGKSGRSGLAQAPAPSDTSQARATPL